MQLIDGKKTSLIIQEEIATSVQKLIQSGRRPPHLAAVLVGSDGGSETYVTSKIKACERVGFKSTLIRHEHGVTETELLSTVDKLNKDNGVDGFIVQLPLPGQISERNIIDAVDPSKDVDGFHPENFGRMALNLPSLVSATPYGILELLKRYDIRTEGKHCVIIGRSHIVGLPLSILLCRNGEPGNCTVTLCHSRTKNIESFTRKADILVCALGKPGFLKADMVSEGAVVIDVGTTRVADTKAKNGFTLKGDVDFESVAPKCSYITPVPGGVGPMTIAALLHNTLEAAIKRSAK
jgi:methylenetetrahydrofolate dehydrogenase (NADP+)/methenyltetrahydrofolate cyclohydrolase